MVQGVGQWLRGREGLAGWKLGIHLHVKMYFSAEAPLLTYVRNGRHSVQEHLPLWQTQQLPAPPTAGQGANYSKVLRLGRRNPTLCHCQCCLQCCNI